MEKISFSLSFLVATPLTDQRAQEEFNRWQAFTLALLKEGILTDPTL